MAHPARELIDQAASDAAASIEAPPASAAETTLAYGAEGACLKKLVDLLALLGHATNDVIKGTSSRLDESVLVDLRAARAELGIAAPALLTPTEIPVGVKGEFVDTATWDTLYQAAALKLPDNAAAADTGSETA